MSICTNPDCADGWNPILIPPPDGKFVLFKRNDDSIVEGMSVPYLQEIWGRAFITKIGKHEYRSETPILKDLVAWKEAKREAENEKI